MISIVLPTHNRVALLPRAIESVLAQTDPNWELIVIDDASTDSTSVYLAGVTDSRVRVLTNETNLRLPRSLNRGFAFSSGELLTWTSDDNTYHPRALGVMREALASDPNVGAVYASMRVVDTSGNVIQDWPASPVEDQPIQPWFGACFLYRREVYDAIGEYDPEMGLAEDLDYWIRIRQRFVCRAIPEVLYNYLDHPESLSQTQRDRVQQAGAKVVARHWENLPWLTPHARALTACGLADAALQVGERRAARGWVREAWRSDPSVVFRSFKRGALAAWLGV